MSDVAVVADFLHDQLDIRKLWDRKISEEALRIAVVKASIREHQFTSLDNFSLDYW